MKTRDSKYWDFGSVPMIEPEYLGSILAAASDIALFVKLDGNILSILVNETEKSLGNLSHWEGRSIRDFLTTESIEKLDVVINQIKSGKSVMHSVELIIKTMQFGSFGSLWHSSAWSAGYDTYAGA